MALQGKGKINDGHEDGSGMPTLCFLGMGERLNRQSRVSLGTARISVQGFANNFAVLERILIVRLEAEGLVEVTGCPLQILHALHLGH